jgi:hypothetical protein
MRKRFPSKLFACLLVLPFLPGITGCLIPYAYPKVSWTPSLNVGPNAEEVRAFRVDVTGDIVDIGESDQFTLASVTPISGEREPAQARLSLEYGIYTSSRQLQPFPVHHGHSTLLRLYRPGYQLVEVKSFEFPPNINWIAAPDLLAQEKAVDALLSVPSIEAPRYEFSYGRDGISDHSAWPKEERNPALRSGAVSAKHKEALLFAASEYDRLALLAPTESEQDRRVRARLLSKADSLRALAGNDEPVEGTPPYISFP